MAQIDAGVPANQQAAEITPEQIKADLTACAEDKVALQKVFEGLVRKMMLAGLNSVESVLTERKTPGHAHNILHVSLRRQLLSLEGDIKRSIPDILKAFRVRQVYDRQVDLRVGVSIPREQWINREGDGQEA